MQFAAGVHPLDTTGTPMALEVIPLIVDPHKANEDLKRTENLLRWYKQIRKSLYGENKDITKGFFSVKISTLCDIIPNGSHLSDTFIFNLGTLSSNKFNKFISYDTLDTANQALCSMLFSTEQLETTMNIGFVGSPNIGSIALNEFKDSEEFKQFANVFQPSDRVFIVSSIFGGTGAAGYPVIVKNIRNAGNNAQISSRGILRDAKIGALTVLPYFNVQQDKTSPITRADFISKTKSALYYYHDNLTGIKENKAYLPMAKINACYYLGDEVPSTPYVNDPGNNGQRNDAHIVEYVGALSILDFLQLPADQLQTINGRAMNPIFKEYGLANDKNTLSLKDFGLSTRMLVNKQLAKFYIAYQYITHQLKYDIGRGYTEDKPEIKLGFLSTMFFENLSANFFVAYRTWLKELKNNQRSFIPFNLDTAKLSESLTDIVAKRSLFKSAIDYNTVLSSLNKISQQATKLHRYNDNNVAYKLLSLLDEALDKLIDEKYNAVE